MRKFLLILCFILCSCSVMANPLCEFYPEKAIGLSFLEKDFFTEFLGLGDDDVAVSNYLKEVNEKTKEMMGFDLKEQVEHVGFFVVQDEFNQIQRLYFLEGKFNFSPIKTCFDNITDENGNKIDFFRDIEFSGFKAKFLHTGSANLIYINDNILLLCSNLPFDMLIRDDIAFGKAPDVVSEILEKRSNFIAFETKVLEILPNAEEFKGKFDFSLIKLVSCYFKNEEFVLELTCKNEVDTELLLPLVDSMLKEYKDKAEQEYNKTLKAIDDSAIALNQKSINSVYYLASIIDFIKTLRVSSDKNAVDIVFTGNRVTMCNILYYVYQEHILPAINRMKEIEKRELCFYKQKAIVAAIEKYNDNVTPSMTYLDFWKLRSDRYLNFSDDFFNSGGCHYRNVGSLNHGGYIYCAKHGRVEPLISIRISNKINDEENRFRCIRNMEAITDKICEYNHDVSYTNKKRKPGSTKAKMEPITTVLDLTAVEKMNSFNKTKIIVPTSECEYSIIGDMTNKGTIACKKHGIFKVTNTYNSGYSEFLKKEYEAGLIQKNNIDEDEFEK